MHGAVALSAILVLATALAACSSAPARAPLQLSPTPDPGLLPGDEVRVRVWREPDLSGAFPVDDRGVVTLPLLGDREVGGLAPAKLREDLLLDYREYLQNPSIEVTVLRRINILGAVGRPGLYPVDTTVSLSEALGLAGGITRTGNSSDIRLIRGDLVVRQALDQATTVGAIDVRSGDQIVVAEKGWFSRNPGAIVGSLITAATIITTALIR